MATMTKNAKDLFDKMAEDKKKLKAYLESGDESKKPVGGKFLKPSTLSSKRS
jgi:hypothetical protein